MPLRHGRKAKTIRAAIGPNIGAELRAGKPFRQAVAIAMSTARDDARKAGVKPPTSAPKKKGDH